MTTEITISPRPSNKVTIDLKGVQGAKGTPGDAATVSVGNTTTVPPGTSASVVNTGTSSGAILEFSIPQGIKGDKGDPGQDGLVQEVVAGTGISVDNTDPNSPIISSSLTPGGQVDSIVAGEGISVSSNPIDPEISLSPEVQISLGLADTAVQPNELATVATTGSYIDLADKPTIPSAQINSDWNSSAGLSEILNKPTLGTAASSNVSDFATAIQGLKADTALQSDDIGVIVQPFDADTAKTDVAQTFTAPQRVSFTTLTYAATVTPDLNTNNAFILTMAGNPVIANPTNMAAAVGQEVLLVFRGAYQPSFGSYWKFPGGEVPDFDGSLNVVGGVVISATEISAFAGAGMA